MSGKEGIVTNRSFDGSYEVYCERVAERVSERGWRDALSGLAASPKFREGRPVEFPGVTLMTPLDSAGALTLHLSQLQSRMKSALGSSLIEVKPDQFHVTGADLVAGDTYRPGLETLIRECVDAEASMGEGLGRWLLSGVALFEHAVVALFIPEQPSSFRLLAERRDWLYSSDRLRALGVKRPRPLMVHVTLGYFASLPGMATRLRWLDALESIQGDLSSAEVGEDLWALNLYRFDDMTSFERVP